MPHLIFSCLESRIEDNGALFGRYLLGPLRIGQATTVATALRRALLSEVQGIGITAVEIVGASHQYSSIKGVRESVLDIILSLKQIVLRGTTVHDLPAIGYINIQGPGIVTANDLILPNGICCVNSNQRVATLSANGLLKIKFVVSVGKSRLTPYADSAHFLSEKVFQPRTRLGGSGRLPLHQRKRLRQAESTLAERQGYGAKDLWFISKLHKIVWGRENNIILYNKKRRSNVPSANLAQGMVNSYIYPFQRVSSSIKDSETLDSEAFSEKWTLSANKKELSSLNASTSALKKGLLISSSSLKSRFFKGIQNYELPDVKPLPPITSRKLGVGKGLTQKEINLVPLKEKHISIEAAKRFNRQLDDLAFDPPVKETGRPVFFEKPAEKFPPNLLPEGMGGGVFNEVEESNSVEGGFVVAEALKASRANINSIDENKDGQMRKGPKPLLSRSILPIDPNFTPITRVNFAIQIDEQWQEPRERIVLEVWSNGSIHPRQAIHEAATNLVYIFSLLR
jgi:DNA-directed RNA polymerase alpha subunit